MTRRIVWDWAVRNYDALLTLLGDKYASRVPGLASGFCEQGQRDAVAAFFEPEAKRPTGTERNLGLALERVARCIRLRARSESAVAAYLGIKR